MDTNIVQPEKDIVSPNLSRWNWGAFLFGWIWGIGNDTYIALLHLVPILGFVMRFYLGFKGNQLAWRNRKWDSVEHFKSVQRKWAYAGVIVIVSFGLIILLFASGLSGLIGSSPPVLDALAIANEDAESLDMLGFPIERRGFFLSGSYSTSSSSSSIEAALPVKGSKSSGTLYVKAEKIQGEWHFVEVVLQEKETREYVVLVR